MDFVYTINKNNPGIGTVYARIRQDGFNKKYSVRYHITPAEWKTYTRHKYNSDTIIQSLDMRYEEFAMVLDLIKHYVSTDFSPESIRTKIQKSKIEVLYGIEESNLIYEGSGHVVDEYIRKLYDDFISGKRLKRGRGVKVSMEYAYDFLLLRRLLMEFQRARCYRLTFEDININFRNDFIVWMKGKRYSHNTICSHLKNIRTLMVAAYEDHVTDIDVNKLEKFTIAAKPMGTIYITKEQIDELYNLDFKTADDLKAVIREKIADKELREKYCKKVTRTRVRTLRKCLDVFLVGLFTGQRFEDYSRINEDMITTIKDEWFIHITQKKNKKVVYVPLDKRVKLILDRNNGKLPKCDNGLINKALDEICRYLGWTDDTGIKRFRMGKALTSKLYGMVRSHTARRSFITNAYISGVNIRSIMAVSGHSFEERFKEYVKLDEEEKCLVAYDELELFMQT